MFVLVRTERLELSWVAPPAPKAGASTNFATSALLFKRTVLSYADKTALSCPSTSLVPQLLGILLQVFAIY